MILCLNLALSGGLGWMTWHCWRLIRGTKRWNKALEGWIKHLSIHLPFFTLRTHRNRLYLVKIGQNYQAGQKLIKIGTFLLSLMQRGKESHGKRNR